MTNEPNKTGPQGSAPDLTNYSVLPHDAYEWFLSAHPWAVAERHRRHAAHHERERRNAADVRAWTDKIDRMEPGTTSRDFEENVRRLAEIMRPLADKSQLRNEIESAAPDDVSVAESRRRLETSRHAAGDYDYRYPERLLGPGAAAYPPPVSGFTADTDKEPGTQERTDQS